MERITKKFVVPGYYRKFRCKCGACRHTCCAGLDVTVSDEEYFRLVGMKCSPALRRDLDVALRPLPDADPGRYACISPNFFGRCRMLDDAGLCRLQSECGYEALPATCRYFPRNPRFYAAGRATCAMANACEETLELLYDMSRSGADGPSADCWTTEETELTFDLAGKPDLIPSGEVLPQIRRMAEAAVREALAGGSETIQVKVLTDLIQWIGDTYDSMRSYAMAVQLRFLHGFREEDYHAALQQLEAHYPAYDNFLRNVVINELFCCTLSEQEAAEDAPVQNSAVSGQMILAYMAAVLVLLSVVNLNETSTEEDLIDLFADFFRMVDLTNYRHNSGVILRRTLGRT